MFVHGSLVVIFLRSITSKELVWCMGLSIRGLGGGGKGDVGKYAYFCARVIIRPLFGPLRRCEKNRTSSFVQIFTSSILVMPDSLS